MTVKISTEFKKTASVCDLDAAYKVITRMKADENTTKHYAEMLARIVSDCNTVKVFESTATVTHNYLVWDAFEEGTGSLDVWVEFTAYSGYGFVIAGAFMSDLLTYTREKDVKTLIRRMTVRKFVETR